MSNWGLKEKWGKKFEEIMMGSFKFEENYIRSSTKPKKHEVNYIMLLHQV